MTSQVFFHMFLINTNQSVLNNELQVISILAFQWKMQFNSDPNKQAQEVYFAKKANNENSLPVTFNNGKVVTCSTHKHLRLLLDKRLSFNKYIQSKMNKCCKMTGVVKRLSVSLPRDTLLRIYKSFIRPLWITKTLFMTNQIASLLKAKLRIFNIKFALQ